ncbi:MAG: hypothetical protein UW69_C0013G0004 [Microgenomates group bacterium GW2011_GWA2_44_7]|nr:MAG: hypothetical protein UW69_C0013G0004 [Microgenomates group bacterium GW2011_GWA2_44_7]KKT78575.1 MAG: hypothetical protein UW73_C0001G0022 [Microgenomates group bacterium GW2011_GWB1_44_8]
MPKRSVFLISLILLAISILGAAIRFYKLGQVPAGLYIDEAAQGYSAYSILKTGKDEFGKTLPIIFRSFTDFKTPVYIYLIVPLIPIFGLTSFAVRFPSFFFSVLTFPLLFLLLIRVTHKRYAIALGIVTTFLLAISPWHTLFGRTNFECNVALFFLLLGVYFFYTGLKHRWMLVLSALMFGVSINAYHSQRIITPLIVIFLTWRYQHVLKDKIFRKPLLIAGICGLLIMLPLLSVATTPGFLSRAKSLNIISQPNRKPAGYISDVTGWGGHIVNSSLFLTSREFLSLYISYFSPRNMFNLGDYGPRSSFPALATFFSWQFPFYIFGLYIVIKKKELGELRNLTLVLLLVSPIPAAVTGDPYTTIRALPLVIPQLIVIGLGIIFSFLYLRNHLRIIFATVLVFLSIYSLLQLYSSAFILNEYYRAKDWDYGFDKVVKTIMASDPGLPVIVDNARGENYIELLFYLRFDPEKYQKENFEVPVSEYYTNLKRNSEKTIGRITTRPIVWEKDLVTDQILVGDELAISRQQIEENRLEIIKEVPYPDRKVAFRIVRTNPKYQMEKRREYILTKGL